MKADSRLMFADPSLAQFKLYTHRRDSHTLPEALAALWISVRIANYVIVPVSLQLLWPGLDANGDRSLPKLHFALCKKTTQLRVI